MVKALVTLFLLALQATAPQPQSSAGATIEGTVIDKATERPVQGVRLTVGSPLPGALQGPAVTDAEGHFLLKGLPAGSHRLSTSKEGYAPAKSEGQKAVSSGLVFTVNRDEQLKGIVIPVVRQGVITGRVFDTNGAPVMNAGVSARLALETYDEFGEKSSSSGGRGGGTNDLGEFRIFGLQPGEYYIQVTSPGPPASVTHVLSYPPGSENSRVAPILVRSGEEVLLPTLYVPIVETAPVRVNIISEAPTAPNQFRSLQFKSKGIPIEQSSSTSGGPGIIENSALPLGTNEVRIALQTAEGMVYGESTFELDQSLEKRTVDVVLRKGVRFVAQTLLEKVDGSTEPLSGIGIQLRLGSLLSPLSGKTGSDGMLSFASTPAATYRLFVTNLPEDAAISRMTQDGKSITASNLVVTGDTRVEIALSKDGGSIEGIVRNSRGNPVPGSLVALVPADRALRDQHYLHRSTTTDQHGKFTLRTVTPGTYKLFAWIAASGAGPFRNAEFMAKYEDRGKEIQIGRGQNSTSDLLLADEDQ